MPVASHTLAFSKLKKMTFRNALISINRHTRYRIVIVSIVFYFQHNVIWVHCIRLSLPWRVLLSLLLLLVYLFIVLRAWLANCLSTLPNVMTSAELYLLLHEPDILIPLHSCFKGSFFCFFCFFFYHHVRPSYIYSFTYACTTTHKTIVLFVKSLFKLFKLMISFVMW